MQTNNPLLNRLTEVEIVDNTHQPWLRVRCRETNFYFIANPPDYKRLSEEFAWEKSLKSERERRKKEEVVISKASSLAKSVKFLLNPKRNKMFAIANSIARESPKKQIRVLDIGCGNGKLMADFCQRFSAQDIQVIPLGIEVSMYLAEVSRRKFSKAGGDVIENNAIDGMRQIEPGSIDMVIMHSFLEHEAKPRELLSAIYNALTSDGSVILKVPNFDCWNRKIRGKSWPGFRFPDHVSYFTPKTLAMLAEQTNFELARQNLSDRLPLSDNMYAVLKKRSNSQSSSIEKAA